MDAMDNVAASLGAVLEEMIGQGFGFPIHFSAIDSNGAMIGASYQRDTEGKLNCNFVCESVATESLELPINLLFTDGTDRAVRVIFRREKPQPDLYWLY